LSDIGSILVTRQPDHDSKSGNRNHADLHHYLKPLHKPGVRDNTNFIPGDSHAGIVVSLIVRYRRIVDIDDMVMGL
jgi:hypothetical protein